MKFCESCGAKIEALLVCLQCGAALGENAKFCESCGTAVSPAAVPEVTTAGTTSARVVQPPAEPEVKETPAELATVASAVAAWTRPDPADNKTPLHEDTAPEKPLPYQTKLIAGILVLALLGAAVYFVVLPMLSGTGTTPQGPVNPAVPAPAGPSATTVPESGTVPLTAGPTQVLPVNRDLVIDVERDAISSVITVKFQGGGGQYAVRELVITLTRSDNTVEVKSFKPEYRGTFITLQGTQRTDRVEVTANFYSGESYKVVDQIFEYKKRSG
jgi:ribosomal protein L40E